MGEDLTTRADGSWLRQWEGVRRKLPAVNLVFAGHPLHAMLTDMPAALIPTGFLFSLLGRLRREPALESAGFATTAAGVVAAVPTAVAGLADYLQMEVTDPAQATGFTHGLLNLLAVSLGLASLRGGGLRKRGSTASICLSGAATGVLLASAYLGGDLVFHRGWRVKPIEREEIEQHHVPATVHEDDFVLRRPQRVDVSSAQRTQL
jgi:uncharacterized membrane protein